MPMPKLGIKSRPRKLQRGVRGACMKCQPGEGARAKSAWADNSRRMRESERCRRPPAQRIGKGVKELGMYVSVLCAGVCV